MPVGGYEHRRVWSYRFRPQPYAVLDRDFLGHDWEWERGVVERLRRGEAGPCSVGVFDAIPTSNWGYGGGGGWEWAEAHAKDANRIHSAYLTDEAIAERERERKARKKALAEALERNRLNVEKEKAERAKREKEREEAAAERRRVEAEERARLEKRAREFAARRAEWERIGAEEKAKERARLAEVLAAAPPSEAELVGMQTEAERRLRERAAILAAPWQCRTCLKAAKIELRLGRYELRCGACESLAVGEHEALVKVIEAKAA